MKAMIFAAGLGTRLKPLTNNCPKAMIPINGKPLLQIVIERLINAGITDIIINVHYLPNIIIDFLQQHHNFGIHIEISDETNLILETGGGLLKAKHFFTQNNQPFLVCNADILTNIDIKKLFEIHQKNNAIATLAIRDRKSSRYLLIDNEKTLCGWENIKTKEQKIVRTTTDTLQQVAFSGYQIISPEIFNHCNFSGIFSMINWYLDVAKKHIIKTHNHTNDIWIDIGTPEKLEEANIIYKQKFI